MSRQCYGCLSALSCGIMCWQRNSPLPPAPLTPNRHHHDTACVPLVRKSGRWEPYAASSVALSIICVDVFECARARRSLGFMHSVFRNILPPRPPTRHHHENAHIPLGQGIEHRWQPYAGSGVALSITHICIDVFECARARPSLGFMHGVFCDDGFSSPNTA